MPWVDESRLDDPEALRVLDRLDSLRSLASAGAQVRRALVSADEAGISRAAGGERPRSVLVAALGGSALVCDVLDLLAEPGSPVTSSSSLRQAGQRRISRSHGSIGEGGACSLIRVPSWRGGRGRRRSSHTPGEALPAVPRARLTDGPVSTAGSSVAGPPSTTYGP